MGCCVSSSTNKDSNFNKVGSESQKSKPTHESRAPPPSLDQEEEKETVKEVLSETPKLKPPPPPEPIKSLTKEHKDNKNRTSNTGKIAHFQPTPPPLFDEKIKIQESRYENEKMLQEEEIFEQEVSEVCSLSSSEKLSTATINNGSMDYDDCDDDEEVKQRVVKSPAPKSASRNRLPPELGTKRDRPPPLVGKSPTRCTDQSSSRRNNAVRLVQSREQMARRGLRSDPNRRDPGENSGRRSRSPASNRSSAIGRSPSAGKANLSPGRVRTDPPDRGGNVMKMGRGMEGDNWPSSAAADNSTTTGSGGAGNESLENPLVSLECFIFL